MATNIERRELLLSDLVNNNTMGNLIESILEINHEDDLKENTVKDYIRKPIKLYINSRGGTGDDAIALIDIKEVIKTPIYTYSIGLSASAGLWIFMCGDKRYIGKNSELMYHEASTGVSGDITNIQRYMNTGCRMQEKYDDIIIKNTSVTQNDLNKIKERRENWYIQANEAIQLGFADGYIGDEED